MTGNGETRRGSEEPTQCTVSHSELMISSGSKWSESKCNESSRISRSAATSSVASLLSCELHDGRAERASDDALENRDEDP